MIVKYIMVLISLIPLIIVFIFNNNDDIKTILKSYNSILIKKNNFNYKEKDIIKVNNIIDLIKISYELDKKIYYIINDNNYTFIIDDKDYLIYEEVVNE